ncbi:MAG: hypothetical protein ACO38P_13310, partial [Phycisphaerales bacterium]
ASHTSRTGELDSAGLEASLRDLGATFVRDADAWRVTLSEGRSDDGLAFAIAGDGSIGPIASAADPVFAAAQAKVEEAWRSSGSDDASRLLPTAGEGAALLAGLADPWGHPLAYRLVAPDRFLIESGGPDGGSRSADDLRAVTTLTLPEVGETVEEPLDWRDRHVPCAKDEVVSGVAEATFTTRVSIGGGELLAGADYYWFFTTVMAVAAGLFVFVAMVYRPKEYIQGEGVGSDTDAIERQATVGRLDDR